MKVRMAASVRRWSFGLVISVLASVSVQAATRYVWSGGNNEPPFDTWAKASKTLTNAIAGAVSPDIILVTNGTYAGEGSIVIPAGVTLRGVGATAADVIVDGGSAYRCFFLWNRPGTVLDGLTIQGGTGDNGGGVYISGSGAMVKNCIFRFNKGTSAGAGIYADGGATVSNCLFYANTNTAVSASVGGGGAFLGINGLLVDSVVSNNVAVSGGGVFNYGGVVRSCVIVGNTANGSGSLGGGGIYVYNYNPSLVTNCAIRGNSAGASSAGGGGVWLAGAGAIVDGGSVNGNTAAGNGGGLYFAGPGLARHCASIHSNTAAVGGGAFIGSGGGTLSNCFIHGNLATSASTTLSGGGVAINPSQGALWACVISNNTSAGAGGGVCMWGGSTAIDCTIADNVSGSFGGGLYAGVQAGQMAIVRCSILRNHATGNNTGGGMHIIRNLATAGDSLTVSNCVIRGNWLTGSGNGGGISKHNTQLTCDIIGCLIVGNSTLSGYGGGVWAYGDARLMNCTIARNQAGPQGGGLANYTGTGGPLSITNCIVYSNTAAATPEIFNNATLTAGYSCSPSPLLTEGLNGNTTKSPRFVDAGNGFGTNLTVEGNFRLQPGSPCVNKGLTEPWMATALDLDLNPRISPNGDSVDMGAYELPLDRGTIIVIR